MTTDNSRLSEVSIWKIVYSVAALTSLGTAFWFASASATGAMWIAFMGFALLMVVANYAAIAELTASATGIKVKMHEVEKVAAEAKATLEQLQSLASAMASVTLASIQQAGRMGGFSEDDRESLKNEVLNILDTLGLPAEQLETVMARWHPFVEFDYSHYILGGNQVLNGVPDEHRTWLKDLRGGGIQKRAKPQDIAKFLASTGLLTDDRKELIRDYEHYLEHRKHRRPEVWGERENWG